jgi:hypothetical protein
MGMSVRNAHPAQNAHPARGRATVARIRVLDRLFLGGCIATYLVLLAAVVAALRAYGL